MSIVNVIVVVLKDLFLQCSKIDVIVSMVDWDKNATVIQFIYYQ
jgi:hypothetical protein